MAGLHFDITGDNKNLLRNLEGSKQGIRSLTREAEKESSNMDDIMKRIGQSAAAIGVGFSATQLIRDVARVRGEFQQLEVALTTMLGSEEKANALFEQLVNTAAKTPFDLKGVAGGAKQLLAYGVAAEEVNDTIIRLGDIAAGLSIPLGDLVYLYGTTMTQGRLFTQDLRQFMGRGIPLADELAKQFGVAKDEVGELVTAGKVGFPEVQKAIMAMTSEGGKFGGLMEKQSKTITGQISNLQDAVDSMLNDIGKSTQGAISGVLTTTTNLVENYKEVAKAIGGVVAVIGTYKAAMMTITAVKNAQIKMEQQALAQILIGKQAEMDADLKQLVTAGLVNKEKALELQASREEVKVKMQTAIATDRMAQAELVHARASYQNQQIQLALSKQRLRQAREELLLAQASGDAQRIENAQLAVNSAIVKTNEERRTSSNMARQLEIATTNANTTAQEREVIAGQLENATLGTMIKQKLALAKANLKVIATNPYFLAAAAAGALAFGIYKVVTAKSAEEKAIDRVNKKREEENKKTEEQKQNIDKLLGVINDDTETRYNQKKAYEDLAKEVPELTNELSLEAFQAMSAAEQTKKLNEVLESIKISKAESQISEYNRLLSELMASGGSWYNLSLETRDALRNMFGNDWKPNVKEATAFLQKEINNSKAMVDDYNESTKPLEVKIEDAQKAADKAKESFEAAKKAYEEEQKRFQEEQKEFGFALPVRFDIAKAYKNAKEEMLRANSNLQSLLGGGNGNSDTEDEKKDKKYWEDKKKAAEDKIAELDVSDIGGAAWKKLDAEVKEANRMLERFSGKFIEEAKKRDEELLELKRQTAEELSDINKSELDRELSDVQESYAKRMEELAKLEEEWKAAQGGRLTDEQSSALSSGRDAANAVRNRGISDAVNAQMERYKQEKDDEKKHLEDLLEEFETYEQARERIANEYAEKRKQMVNEDGSLKAGFTQGNLDNVNAQQREAEDALDQAMLEKSESYQAWLESIETKTLDSLREALVQAKFALEMATMRGDSKGTATAKAQIDALSKKIKEMETSPKKRSLEDWRNLSEAISEAGDSFEELSEELESMGGDVGKVAGAILKSVGSIGSSTIGLINNITQLTQMSIKGTQETSEESSKAIKGVEKASVILAIISTAVQIITKIINLANQMHDAKYDKVIEENQAKIDSMKKSYEGMQEQLEETFGTGAVQTLQEMNASLEQQNKLIEEQKRAEEEKKKTDESAMQGYDDALEANRKQMEENTKAMEEAIFGDDIKSAIESFAEAYGDAIAEGKDLNQSMKDHAVQMMKQMVQEEIKAYIAGQGKLEALREKMALYFEDGVFSDSEIAAIKAEAEAIGKDLDRKFAWAEDLLAEEDSSSSSSSSKRGIATASQESVDENNGRLMSIQLSMGEIKEQMIYTVTYLASMTSSISSSNHILSDIREQAVRTNGHLEDIVKYTKPLNDKISEVVSAVNRINSK